MFTKIEGKCPVQGVFYDEVKERPCYTSKKFDVYIRKNRDNDKLNYRIRANIDIGEDVKAGDWGGCINYIYMIPLHDNTWVYPSGIVYGERAIINSGCRIYGCVSSISEDPIAIEGKVIVPYGCEVSGNFSVHFKGEANNNYVKLSSNVRYKYGHFISPDFLTSKVGEIYASAGVLPDNLGNYILYKNVWRDKSKPGEYISDYDTSFRYKLGKVSAEKQTDFYSAGQCTAGIHVANAGYCFAGNAKLAVKVNIKNIVWWGDDKLRCSRVTPLYEVKNWGIK